MKELLFCHIIAFLTGFLLDILFGDPRVFFHPIRLIGNLILGLEKALYLKGKPGGFRGIILVITVLIVTGGLTFAITIGAYLLSYNVGIAVEAVLTWFIFSVKSLYSESMKVHLALNGNDVVLAKDMLSMIVGRDTNVLDHEGIINATIETVAENTCDGVVAPIIYTAIGGPVPGMLYKAVNTMDSMIGYKNERYEFFGRAAAKLDDFINFIPARIAARILIVGTVFVKGFDTKGAISIYYRDRNKTSSPNAGQCESVVAGGLGIRLLGPATYFGIRMDKPYIGDKNRPSKVSDIVLTNRLMIAGALITVLFCGTIVLGVYIWIR